MCRWNLGLLILVLSMLGSSASALEGEAECPKWFPDFRCERQGRYEGFVMPMQMPYLFEEPFITSGLNAVGIWHDYPGKSAFEGGDIWVLALQLRVAITDRLAFIATKDGLAFHRPNNDLLTNKTGFLDIAAGFKYALIDMPEHDFILSPSFRIDIPVGQRKVFSGNGSGVAIPGVSWAWGPIDRVHMVGDLGGRIPFDGDKETTQFFWNFHLDYGLLSWLVPFFEIGGLHYTNSGNGNFMIDTSLGILPLTTVQDALMVDRFDAVDVANIGSIGVAGNDIVIATFGARFPLNRHLSLGASYDFPVTSREDIFHQRATVMVTYDF